LWYTGRVPESYQRKPNSKCIICDTLVYRRPVEIEKHGGRIFCSLACYGLSCRKELPCLVCGKLILSGSRKSLCSRECSNKHRSGIRYKINSPRDKAKLQKALKNKLLEIRGKKCERCDYEKHRILQVHHKDRNRENNDLTNLELICPNCHCEEHYN